MAALGVPVMPVALNNPMKHLTQLAFRFTTTVAVVPVGTLAIQISVTVEFVVSTPVFWVPETSDALIPPTVIEDTARVVVPVARA